MRAIAAAAALASLLGIGVASAAERPAPLPSTAPQLLYVSNTGTATISIYDQAGLKQIGSLTPGVGINAMVVDAQGSLWVAGDKLVEAYRTGQTKPYLTLHVPTGAGSLAIADDGTVYVGTGYPTATIDVFAKGSTSVTSTLPLPELSGAAGLMVDARGTLYATGGSAKVFAVSRVFSHAAGAKAFTELPFVFMETLGITGDAAGNLVVADAQDQGIYVLDPGNPEPVRVVGRTRQTGPTAIALSADERRLYAYDYFHSEVDVYDYATGDLIHKLPIPGGYYKIARVATSPRAPLGGAR